MTDCFVIGKGPAGISAGIYVKRGGFSVTVCGTDDSALQKAEKIENYYGVPSISGKELFENGIRQAQSLGVSVLNEEVLGVEYLGEYFSVKTDKRTVEAKTVVIATGAPRKKAEKFVDDYLGKGVSYCAVCDGFLFRKKSVGVLGEGAYARSEAEHLKSLGCSVTVFTDGKPPVSDFEGFEVEKGKLNALVGEPKLTGVLLDDGRKIELSALFVALGTASALDFAKKIGLDEEDGHIKVKNGATNCPGLFAAGDATGGFLQVSTAVGEGAIAGREVCDFLRAKS